MRSSGWNSKRAYEVSAPNRVDFTVTSADTVEYSWDVTGPAKDQLLTTVLTRIRGGS